MAVKKKGVSKNRFRDIFVALLFFPLLAVILLLVVMAIPFVFLYGLVVGAWEQTVRLPLVQTVKVRVGVAAVLLLITISAVLLRSWLTAVFALLLTSTILFLLLPILQKSRNRGLADWHQRAREAIEANDLPALKELLPNRDVNQVLTRKLEKETFSDNPSLLYIAAVKEQAETVALLFKLGADPNLIVHGFTQIWDPFSPPMNKADNTIIDLFLSNGLAVNRPMWVSKFNKTTPLIAAVHQQNPALIKKLLQAGADINYRPYGYSSPLSNAIQTRNQALVQLLLEQGADPNVLHRKNKQDILSSLYFAAQVGETQIVDLLLQHRADPNNGVPALIAAIENGHQPVIDQLYPLTALEETAAYDILWHTVQAQNLPLAQKLLAQNIPLNHPHSSRTKSLVYLAVEQDNPALLTLLLEHGAEPDLLYETAKEQGGMGISIEVMERKSPLALALETNSDACRQLLLEYVDLTAVAYAREVWEDGDLFEEKQQTGQQLIDAHPAINGRATKGPAS